MILSTCLKAGHRWGAPVGASRPGWRVEIRQCQRVRCARFRFEESLGFAFTYDWTAGGSTNVKIVSK